jgi:proline iminopeptidase
MSERRSTAAREAKPAGPRLDPPAGGGTRDGMVGAIASMWSDRRIMWSVATALPAVAALLVAMAMPRGPITTGQALAAMAGGALVGAVAGLATRSRWAMLVCPAVYAGTFELVRVGADGPSMDGIHVDTPVGLFAFATGRVFHGVTALLPLALGATAGAGLARHWAQPHVERRVSHRGLRRAGLYARRGVAALMTAALVVLGVLIARPARTAPILGEDGRPLAGSVTELTTARIGGHNQAIMIRGKSEDNPVLLYLAGGPGGTDIGAMRMFSTNLERNFVVATWDQRGAGKSYRTLDPASTLTLDRMVADTVEVTNLLRRRFDEPKIFLVGNSWGTTLGVLAVQRHPNLYHAFVGTGQMVSQRETDRMFYEDTIAWAERTGDAALARRFREHGPPPYEDPWPYAAMLSYEREWNDYPRNAEYDARGEMPFNVFVNEYSLMEQVHAFNAFLDTAAVLYPQLQEIDFRRDVPRLDVPLYLVQGRHEARGRAALAVEWFQMLQAPSKQLIVFELSGHRPLFEEPDRFHRVMTDIVLRESESGR